MWASIKAIAWWQVAIVTLLVALIAGQMTNPAVAVAGLLAAALIMAAAMSIGGGVPARAGAGEPVGAQANEFSAVIDQCDPDAAGRPRPRAPGVARHR